MNIDNKNFIPLRCTLEGLSVGDAYRNIVGLIEMIAEGSKQNESPK